MFAFPIIDSIKPDHHLFWANKVLCFISSPDISGIICVRNCSLMWVKELQSSPMFGCYIPIYISCPFRFGAPWERMTQERSAIGCDSPTVIMSLMLQSWSVKRKYLYLCKNMHFYAISFEFRQNGCFPMEYFICAWSVTSHLASSTIKRLSEHKVTGNKQNCGCDFSYWPFYLKGYSMLCLLELDRKSVV